MKNKTFYINILLLFIIFFNKANSDNLEFLTKDIEILDKGNLIQAENDIKIIDKIDKIEITAEKFKYDKKKLLLTLTNNIEFTDNINQLKLNAEKMFFDRKKNIISTVGSSSALLENNYIIDSKNLFFDRNKNEFYSSYKTKIKDNFGNIIILNKFKLYNSNKILKGSDATYIDNMKNKLNLKELMVNLRDNKFSGKDFNLELYNATFGNPTNNPRMKGNVINATENETKISKGVFTTCKKTEKCPPWQMSAETITHNKSKKIIDYKNAWLKLYDIPVLYFPKFFHPDPTVKRQSGFLIPKYLNSSKTGNSVDLPYYHVLADNKDMTFTPRIYSSEQLYQLEYRQVGKETKNMVDFSFAHKENDNKTHFFSNSTVNLGLSAFEFSSLELNLQNTSKDTYLKTYKLKSPLITNDSVLNSNLKFEASREDLSIDTSFQVYNDLNKRTSSNKYEYVYPEFNINKIVELDSNKFDQLVINSSGYQKQFDTNIYEAVSINDFIYKSNGKYTNTGIKNNYSLLLKNTNIKGKNSSKYENDLNHDLLTSFIMESSYPLKKETMAYNNYFTPTISYRFSPNNSKDIRNDDRRIDINNIFSFNRLGRSDTIENGHSITLGAKYEKKDKKNNDFILLNMASVFRNEANDDLPIKSSIGRKTSDLVGNFKIIPNEHINFDYNFSIDNNLDRSNYDSIKTNLSLNNFATSFEYLEENNFIGNESYITNETSYSFSDQKKLKFSTRKNKKTDLTEFYNLIYEYKNDCLTAAVEYNKEYYQDTDFQPNEQIYFSITIIPFAQTNLPGINR
tara:strand:- start:205 stop:2592 length:2388 start_codon:yes stop_codon:yes gene_type:complete